MSQPSITLVIVPRERFSAARRSLESVLANTNVPYDLVYVQAGGPADLDGWLREQAEEHGFTLHVQTAPLRPNQARNLGLTDVDSTYVAFLDNDVIVEPGWLDALVRCAQETGAGIVGPATLIGGEDRAVVHLLGGDLHWDRDAEPQRLTEEHRFAHQIFGSDPRHRERAPCALAEFHGMLVRRSVLEALGPLDEALETTKEHVDLCIAAQRAGHRIWYEPTSVITYLTRPPLTLADAPFFRFRWDLPSRARDIAHCAEKWNIDPASRVLADGLTFGAEHLEWVSLPDAARVRWDSARSRRAQTPVQLLDQLRDADASDDELARAHTACNLSVSLFAGIHRADGTPFLCHAVGTASLLLAFGAPLQLTLAGLLHGAYSHGLFDAGPPTASPTNRTRVRAVVGAPAERLITHYLAFDWSVAPPDADADLEQLPCEDAAVHLMRIANDLDECLDGGIAHTVKASDARGAWRPFWRRLTQHLGVPELARALDRAVEDAARTDVDPALRSDATTSYLIHDRTRRRIHPHRRPLVDERTKREKQPKTIGSRIRDEWRRMGRRLRKRFRR